MDKEYLIVYNPISGNGIANKIISTLSKDLGISTYSLINLRIGLGKSKSKTPIVPSSFNIRFLNSKSK